MDKKGAMKLDSILMVLLIVGVGLFIANNYLGLNIGTQSTTGTTTETEATPSGYNAVSTTATFTSQNVLATGTDPNQYARIYLNGIDKGQVAEGGTLTVAPGDKLVMYFAENSSATGYYTDKQTATVPDTGAKTYQGQLYAMDTGVTQNYKNDAGQVDTAQSMGASSTYNFDLTFRASSQKAFGNPQLGSEGYSNAYCVTYNSTQHSSIDLVMNGVSVGTIQVPQVVASDMNPGFAVKCFKMPVIQNSAKWEPTLVVKTSTSQPLTDSTINQTIQDVDYTLNSITGAEIIGFENENGVDIGSAGVDFAPLDED